MKHRNIIIILTKIEYDSCSNHLNLVSFWIFPIGFSLVVKLCGILTNEWKSFFSDDVLYSKYVGGRRKSYTNVRCCKNFQNYQCYQSFITSGYGALIHKIYVELILKLNFTEKIFHAKPIMTYCWWLYLPLIWEKFAKNIDDEKFMLKHQQQQAAASLHYEKSGWIRSKL